MQQVWIGEVHAVRPSPVRRGSNGKIGLAARESVRKGILRIETEIAEINAKMDPGALDPSETEPAEVAF